MLAAPREIYPQFATHNAQTLASIYHMASAWHPGQYEFQCLHGMGEPLYMQVVGSATEGKLGRPCRIYAPVGTHETLLAYLVRRLLENGAKTSFINACRSDVSLDDLVADPVSTAAAHRRRSGTVGSPHPRIPCRVQSWLGRANSRGMDLSNENELERLSKRWPRAALAIGARAHREAATAAETQPVRNPADRDDLVGHVTRQPQRVEASLYAATLQRCQARNATASERRC